jgi:hypothetical protein
MVNSSNYHKPDEIEFSGMQEESSSVSKKYDDKRLAIFKAARVCVPFAVKKGAKYCPLSQEEYVSILIKNGTLQEAELGVTSKAPSE